jgi:hypothetical protein
MDFPRKEKQKFPIGDNRNRCQRSRAADTWKTQENVTTKNPRSFGPRVNCFVTKQTNR